MASWGEFTADVPCLARQVRERFGIRKHCTLATLRKDGSPRISGTEVDLTDEELWIGSMPSALKALDLRRDPRMALHSPTEDPPEDNPSGWPGEAKIGGLAVEVPTAAADLSHRFRIDITEVVLTRVGDPPDHLVICSWHPGRGYQERRRA